jgi:CRP/FNR family transcriptional regulator, anaerobic regulatory protein
MMTIATLAPRVSATQSPEKSISAKVAYLTGHCSNCALRDRCLPSGLSDEDMALFDDVVFTRKRVKRGDSLYRSGDAFDSIYALRGGFFKSSMTLADGREQVTGFHMAGEIVGMGGIGTQRHTADIVALEDSEVCIIPYARLDKAGLQRQLQKAMSRELVREQGVMLLLGTMRAPERLAAFLLNLSKRFGALGLPPDEFHLRMTRIEIGSYLGLALETVSRLFSRFHDDGLIAVQQKHIRILDIAGLESLLVDVNDQGRSMRVAARRCVGDRTIP